MNPKVQRSMLILPINVPKFVERAHERGSDAIVLDLEDAVPQSEKESARKLVKDSIRLAGLAGADVLVRVNNDEEHIWKDLESSVFNGLSAIFLPKTEYPDQIMALETMIGKLERERNIEPGSIRISIHIESPVGILNMKDIASTSSRLESISLGVDDYCLQMGIRPSREASELVFPMSNIAMVARSFNLIPLGVLGSVAEYRDKDRFRLYAENSKKMGFSGGYCIHPDQVAILNDVFSPSEEEIIWGKRVMTGFEEAVVNGRASTSLDGKMVDTPIYRQAMALIERSEAIQMFENKKREIKLRNTGI